MNRDLDAALQDLAQHAAGTHRTRREDGAGVSTSAVVHRVRRRRQVRAGLTTATALVAVTGLVLAGVALADRRDPLPADTPTVAPSPSITAPVPAPSPTPTTPAVALPTGDPALPFGECGSIVGSATEPATDPSASIIVTSTPVADHGGVIETSAQMIPPPESYGAYQRTSGPQIVITRDDVVVATIVPLPAQYDELELVVNYDPRFSPATFVTHSVPVVCDDGSGTGSAGAALPPGDYQVMAVGDLWWTTYDRGDSGHPTTADGLPGWDPVSVVAAPVPLRITDAPGEPLGAPTGAPPLPPEHDWQLDYQCQEPPESTTTPALTASGSSETRYISSGERMRVDMTMAFSGPGRVSANMVPGLLMLRRDGKTIGVVSSNYPPSKEVNMDAGTQIPFTTIADDYRACGEDEEPGSLTPIPAGTYEAYPMVSVYVNGLYSSDGELLFTEDDVWDAYAVSTPFTLVVS